MFKYKDKLYEIQAGDTWQDVCVRNGLEYALAACVGGRPQSLTLPAAGEAHALTYADEEGRRIYERSLRFLMLIAVEKLSPGTGVRFENTLGGGILVSLKGKDADDAFIKELEAEMKRIAKAALPFKLTVVSKQEAISYFEANGRLDTARLLAWREKDTFNLYECGGLKDYFYGEMVPDTSYVGVFSLVRADREIVLILPDLDTPSRPARFVQMNKLLDTFKESNEWLRILGVQNVSDLNELTMNGNLREFIRVNEALMDMKINRIAEMIIERGARLILIAGPSSSGKTTFCNRLSIALKVHGQKPVKLSLDDYYLDRDKVPLDEDGKPDLECIEALDVDMINTQLAQILRGEEVEMPTFDFYTQKRSGKTHKIRVDTSAPVLIEGIHGLNERLTSSVPANEKFKIYISALMNLNIDDHNRIRTTEARLIRRMVRDSAFRGTPIEQTLEMWDSVRRGEIRYIFPFQELADVMINSSLVYELAIMKNYIYDKLCAVTPDKPWYARARRLVKFLNYIVPADAEDEIPLNSLLREFIGGSCFYR
ncbi:MAG: nucleoside kinase [Clostridia bacterium]|nr:nucleoside kinase [Clostridia bacterium]